MSIELRRLAYSDWMHSHLSTARHYGGCKINGVHYEYDREVVKQMHKENDDNKLYKPDLVAYEDMNKGLPPISLPL